MKSVLGGPGNRADGRPVAFGDGRDGVVFALVKQWCFALNSLSPTHIAKGSLVILDPSF